MKITLLNAPILTENGSFFKAPITLAQVQWLIEINGQANIRSAIGHQSTAEILSELLAPVDVKVNRQEYKQSTPEDAAIVFRLRKRGEEGRVYTRKEIEATGYDFEIILPLSVKSKWEPVANAANFAAGTAVLCLCRYGQVELGFVENPSTLVLSGKNWFACDPRETSEIEEILWVTQ